MWLNFYEFEIDNWSIFIISKLFLSDLRMNFFSIKVSTYFGFIICFCNFKLVLLKARPVPIYRPLFIPYGIERIQNEGPVNLNQF